ncbi:MAG: TolC family protein [Cryomorphaceae bacterium]|nr:MAG: TolC family protein [Cryomorphaceae bacterium]
MRKLVYILLFFSNLSFAQEVLTTDMAVKLTLENNLDIKVSKNVLEISKNNSSILNSDYLPTINATSSVSRAQGDVKVKTNQGISAKINDTSNDESFASVNIVYNIVDGRGRKYNYQKSKELYSRTELEVREIIENTLLQLFTVYFDFARLTREKEILKNTLGISIQRLERVKTKYKFGQSTSIEVSSAQVDKNTDSLNYLNIIKVLSNTKRDLNLIMNIDLESDFEVVEDIEFTDEKETEDFFNAGLSNNTMFQILDKDVEISNLELKAIKSTYLPTVQLRGSYGWNETIDEIAYNPVNEFSSKGVSTGVNISIPIFDGGKRITATKNARINLENSLIQKNKSELEIIKNIRNAYETYKNNLFLLQIQEKSYQTSKLSFSKFEEKYSLGLVSSLEFRQAQTNLLRAELLLNSSLFESKISELVFLKLTGKIVDNY